MQKVLQFVDDCRRLKYDMREFCELFSEWETTKKNFRKIIYDELKQGIRNDSHYFIRRLNCCKRIPGFSLESFQYLYEKWIDMNENERWLAYGSFYKKGNRKITGKVYPEDKKLFFAYEYYDEDEDLKTPDSNPNSRYAYKCRDCGFTTRGNYYTDHCTICGSINIYAFSQIDTDRQPLHGPDYWEELQLEKLKKIKNI